MTPEARIAELEERNFRLAETLRAIAGRAEQWKRPEPGEYYRAGMATMAAQLGFLAAAGLRWAEGLDEGPE
jgi:hypothetical protein